MKLSFTTMATPELTFPQQVAVAKEYGFGGLDPRMQRGGQGEIPESLTEEQAQEMVGILDGLEIPGILCYNSTLAEGAQAMEASILQCLRMAELLHCPLIRIFTGKVSGEEDLARLETVLRRVFAQDTGNIRIGIQNHAGTSLNLAQSMKLCSRMNHPRLGIILSPDHCYSTGEELEPVLPDAAKYVFELYVADEDEEKHLVHTGFGRIPYGAILKTLYRHGFDGYVTLKWEKCWHPELAPYPESFRAFMDWAHGAGL